MASVTGRGRRHCGIAALLAAAASFHLGPPGPEPPATADLEVLFVGNSLTSTNDLPAMVAEIATSAGATWLVRSRTAPGFSLEDHWRAGGEEAVRSAAADFVVLQQGPSSLPGSAEHLARWSAEYARVTRERGGRPVLLMVWPSRARWDALGAVRAAYAGAAAEVDGVLAPAGSVWGRLLAADPAMPLTLPDGFHPSRLGTFAAALTLYGSLTGGDPGRLPCPGIAGTEAERAAVCQAVRDELRASSAAAILLDADRAFAAASAARGADAWADAWASDGLLSRADGTLLRGPDAVREAMAPTLSRYGARFRWAPTEGAVVWPDGLGYTIGRWWIEADEDGRRSGGEYLTAWVRRGGAWKVALDAPLPACDGARGARAFGDRLGAWNVDGRIRTGQGVERHAATDVVTPTRQGCVVVESWAGRVHLPRAGMASPRPVRGAGLWLYDPESGRWSLFWSDDVTGSFGRPFVGRFEGGSGELLQPPDVDGAPARRIRLHHGAGTAEGELAVRAAPDAWTWEWKGRWTRS